MSDTLRVVVRDYATGERMATVDFESDIPPAALWFSDKHVLVAVLQDGSVVIVDSRSGRATELTDKLESNIACGWGEYIVCAQEHTSCVQKYWWSVADDMLMHDLGPIPLPNDGSITYLDPGERHIVALRMNVAKGSVLVIDNDRIVYEACLQ
jgi:hypothetical protein